MVELYLLGAALLALAFYGYYHTEQQKKRERDAAPVVTEGTPRAPTASQQAQAVIGVLLLGAAAWYFFGGGLETQADRTMTKIEQKVASDAESQYKIVKAGTDRIATCVQAGMVAAAYLQAKDQKNYDWWKTVERDDCAKAGISH